MDVSVGLVFIIVFLVTFYLFAKSKNLPPGPVGLPIIGSIFLVSKFRHQRPHNVLLEAAKEYGHVMSFRIRKKLFVVLTGYDAVHEALVRQADVFSDRPTRTGLDHGQPGAREFQDRPEFLAKMLNGGVLFNKYGHSWRMLRRFTLQSLRDFGVGKTSIEEKIFAELDVVNKAFQDSEGRPISTTYYTQKLVGNILIGIVFGKRYEYDDPEFDRIRNMTMALVSGTGLFSASQILPRFLAKILSKKDMENTDMIINSVRQVREHIAQEIKEHEATFDKDNIRDFIDIYLQAKLESGSEEDQVDMANMFRVIMDLFLAGTETTYASLDWALLYMSEYPDVQAKCQQEIQTVFGDRQVKYADRGSLSYLEATLNEVMRMTMIASIALTHATTRDTTLLGYNIPAGTLVMPNLWSVSRDPKHWDDPDTFRPERFLDGSGKLLKKEAFMPFGTGPRVCLGEPLAKMELFLVFSNLLQRFTFKRETENVPHSLESKDYHITNVATPYKLRVYKRV